MKKLLLTAILLAFPSPSPAVPVPWIDGTGITHEYELFNLWDGYNSQSWDFARAYIRGNLGADWDLATITSAEEDAFVAEAVVGDLVEEYWIGGYQDPQTADPSAGWMWVTGEPWAYTNWLEKEPSDTYGAGSEQFLALANWERTCQWNDEYAVGNVYGFIAERTIRAAAVPEPGTGVLLLLGLAGGAACRCRRGRRVSRSLARSSRPGRARRRMPGCDEAAAGGARPK